MCDCLETVKNKAISWAAENHTGSKNHEATIEGCSLVILDDQLVNRLGNDAVVTFDNPLKTRPGEFVRKQISLRVLFTFCPFCGELYIKKEGAA